MPAVSAQTRVGAKGCGATLFSGEGRGTAQLAYPAADGHVTKAVLGFGALTGTQTCSAA